MNNRPNKPCKFCGELTHYPYQCYRNPKVKQRRTITNKGKYFNQWMVTRKTWFRKNPPNDQGFYICYICNKWLYPNQTTLDHIKSRSRHPELRFVLSNLAPCCYACNEAKGSEDGELMLGDDIIE